MRMERRRELEPNVSRNKGQTYDSVAPPEIQIAESVVCPQFLKVWSVPNSCAVGRRVQRRVRQRAHSQREKYGSLADAQLLASVSDMKVPMLLTSYGRLSGSSPNNR